MSIRFVLFRMTFCKLKQITITFTQLDRFTVSFVPAEACDHIISVSFNKVSVPNCPITVPISGQSIGPQVSLAGPGPVHLPNSLTINHADGRLEDIEVNVEGILL